MHDNAMLLSVAEVARLLRISRASAYGLVQSGKIPCYRVGPQHGVIRVRRDEVEYYLQGCRLEKPTQQVTTKPRRRLKHLS